MAEYIVQSESLTAIADKIRVLSGTEDAMGLDDMATNVGEANTEVDTQADLISQITAALANKTGQQVTYGNEDGIIDGTIAGNYVNDRITTIKYGAFASCTNLTSINFPVCTSIGGYAFDHCSSLTSVSFPVCTSIGSNAFASCTNLTSINFPVCTSIGGSTFNNCTKLASVSLPICTSIGYSAFGFCSKLTSISFPACTSIAGYAFYYCTNLTSVSFPICDTIADYAFRYCTNLTSVSFPACIYICSNAFLSCYNLSQFYLTDLSIPTLQNSNAFSSTPYAGYKTSFSGTPYIYVPSSLITTYQSATNWAYFSSYFSAIENCADWDGNYGVGDGSLITFTINGTEYQAEDGMRWIEWVESEYNTGGFSIMFNAYIGHYDGQYKFVYSEGWTQVSKNDMITKNFAYTMS